MKKEKEEGDKERNRESSRRRALYTFVRLHYGKILILQVRWSPASIYGLCLILYFSFVAREIFRIFVK